MNSLRFYRELPVTQNSNAYILVWYFLMYEAVLSRNCMQQHRPSYVQQSSVCLGKPSNVLKFSTKVSSSISFRLLRGLLFCLKFLILKLHLEATDLKFSIVLDNAYLKEFMNQAATQNKPNLADAHNHVRIKIQEKALLDSFCCLRHRNSNSYRLDKLCA